MARSMEITNFPPRYAHSGSRLLILPDNHDFAGIIRQALANTGAVHCHAHNLLVVDLEPFGMPSKVLRKASSDPER